MTDESPEDLLTVKEVGQILRRGPMTVLRRIRDGSLKSCRQAQIHYIKRRWVQEYVDSLPGGIKTRNGKDPQ